MQQVLISYLFYTYQCIYVVPISQFIPLPPCPKVISFCPHLFKKSHPVISECPKRMSHIVHQGACTSPWFSRKKFKNFLHLLCKMTFSSQVTLATNSQVTARWESGLGSGPACILCIRSLTKHSFPIKIMFYLPECHKNQ